MKPPRVALLAAAVLAASCTVPQRDNPFDPVDGRIPIARIAVTVENGGVSSPGLEGNRQSIFHFDAGVSSGPPGVPLIYEWETDDPAWDTGSPDDFNNANTAAVLSTPLTLTSSMIATSGGVNGVGSAVRTVKVRVTAGPGGYTSIASVQVVVRNEAPDAGAVEDWVLAEQVPPTDVVLDACGQVQVGTCAVGDPDGDPLAFTWTQTAGPALSFSSTDPDQRRIHFHPVASTRGFEFRVDVSDGLAVRHQNVIVRSGSVLWFSTINPSRLYRVFADFRGAKRYRRLSDQALTPFGAQIQAAAADSVSGEYWLADGNAVRRFDRGFTELQNWPFNAISVATDNAKACAIGIPNAAGAWGIWILRANGTMVQVQTGDGAFTEDLAVSDGSGGCWTAIYRGGVPEIGHVDANNETYTFVATAPAAVNNGSFYGIDYIAAAPDGGLWVAVDDDGVSACRGLCHVTAQFAVASFPISQPDSVIVDPDGSSVLVHTYGFSTYERYTFAAGTVALDGPVSGLPPVNFPGPSLSDVADATIWITDESGQLFRCSLRQGNYRCNSLFVDDATGAAGGSWFRIAIDTQTGSVLAGIYGSTTSEMVVVPPHLQHQDFVPLPVGQRYHKLSVDPASGEVWYSDGYVVGNLGLHKYTGAGVVVLASNGAITASQTRDQLATATRDGGAWVYRQNMQAVANEQLVHVDRLGVDERVIALDQEQPNIIAAGPDGTLCMTTVGFISPQELLRVTPAGVLEVLATGFFQQNGYNSAAASADGSCWFVGNDASTMHSRLLRFAAGSTTPSVDHLEPTRFADQESVTADPRDDSVWVTDGASIGEGSNDRIVRYNVLGTAIQTFNYDAALWPTSVWRLALRKLCSDAMNPACLDVFEESSTGDHKLYRTDGRMTQPFDSTDYGGEPVTIDIAP